MQPLNFWKSSCTCPPAVEAEDDAEPMSSDWSLAAGSSAWEPQITLAFGDVQPECDVEGRAQVLLSYSEMEKVCSRASSPDIRWEFSKVLLCNLSL